MVDDFELAAAVIFAGVYRCVAVCRPAMHAKCTHINPSQVMMRCEALSGRRSFACWVE